MFKGGVQQSKLVGTSNNNTSDSNSSASFAFPSGWDFQTTYNLTVKNN
jgi:hypothetical protein